MAIKTNFPTVPDGAARSVAGPTQGWCDAGTSASEEYINLSAWAGHYITIEAETEDHYVAFTTAAAGTIVDGVAATVGTALVPRTIYADTPNPPMVVPPGATFLAYRTIANAGVLRITRS
jgi:hypothetical protein